MQNFVKEFRFGQCKYIHKLEINEKKWVGMGWNGLEWVGMGWVITVAIEGFESCRSIFRQLS